MMLEDRDDGHLKAMWEGQANILVSVRVRPLLKHDPIKRSCVRVLDSKLVVILDPSLSDKNDILRAHRNREKNYAFDFVFEPNSSQEVCYNNTTKFLIHGVLDGFNATVFAYGQTGSGKTYTMIGTEENPGIMIRVMSDLFAYSTNQSKELGISYKVIVSFLEVYNENIRDLLGIGELEEYLDLREDPIKGPVIAGITEVEAKSSNEIMKLLHRGNSRRSQAATAANEVSSRSHAVLQVIVEARDRSLGHGVVDNIKVGKLSLVDLAGSERAANTQNRGARLVEGANINRSLLALGNCINALGEKGNRGNFVPYRDSKLTRLLKDSLGGNCRTVMIANISSSESSFEETLNTLKYANRAKNIKTEAKRNVLNVNYHISEYVDLINNLRGEIKQLKEQMETHAPLPGPTITQNKDTDDTQRHHRISELEIKTQRSTESSLLHEKSHGLLLEQKGSPSFESHMIYNSTGSNKDENSNNNNKVHPSTPIEALRGSLKTSTSNDAQSHSTNNETRELLESMRQMIVSNFQERMQLRRSLIELEDQNVQNSIEVSKRQLVVVQWTENLRIEEWNANNDIDLSAHIIANAPNDVVTAWKECEQLRKAVTKNNSMKKSISKRLRHNEKEAETLRDELSGKITGEDRRDLMELQYQVGRLELENMELEQHRIVHESVLKGKDLTIQKLKLQLAVKDKVMHRQQQVLKDHHLEDLVGYSKFILMEKSITEDANGPRRSKPSIKADVIDKNEKKRNNPHHHLNEKDGGRDHVIESKNVTHTIVTSDGYADGIVYVNESASSNESPSLVDNTTKIERRLFDRSDNSNRVRGRQRPMAAIGGRPSRRSISGDRHDDDRVIGFESEVMELNSVGGGMTKPQPQQYSKMKSEVTRKERSDQLNRKMPDLSGSKVEAPFLGSRDRMQGLKQML